MTGIRNFLFAIKYKWVLFQDRRMLRKLKRSQKFMRKYYNCPIRRERLKDQINRETWFGAQVDSGGHALAYIQPLTDYEVVSVLNAITGNLNMNPDAEPYTKSENWYTEKWSK